jgi:hypothetical protein
MTLACRLRAAIITMSLCLFSILTKSMTKTLHLPYVNCRRQEPRRDCAAGFAPATSCITPIHGKEWFFGLFSAVCSFYAKVIVRARQSIAMQHFIFYII